MGSIASGHKIEVIGIRRIEGCIKARPPWIADRSRGKAAMQVSVVGRIDLEITVKEARLVLVENEKHSGAGFQRPVQSEPIQENREIGRAHV